MNFIREQEKIAEEVSDWAVDLIEAAVIAIMPDGIPFGMSEASEPERIAQYMKFRGDPAAWKGWIADRAILVVQQLAASGVSEEAIAGINPVVIAEHHAMAYSIEMEEMISG
ncbi:hypothetical protein LCGC14_0740520 [marine sediment metagenome]|uniref:Uncharacterized protein n=1 Tax=marine sediment metagenome TaxID=412755 RepID=A0A0F9TE23_9ZZZZ